MAKKQQKQVVGYVRVSVDNDEKVSPEIQAEAIARLCDAKGWELIDTLVERGKSAGEGKRRPKLDAARKMIRSGRASGLVVSKIDRCSRSVLDFSVLLAELQEHRADFVSTSESFDTSSPMGKAMLQITMVFAELERARSSERITEWHQHRTRNGAPPPKLPFGYCREHDDDGRQVGPVLLDEPAAALVRAGVDLLLQTQSLADVERLWAAQGVAKHPTSIRQTLTSPTLAGVRRLDGTRDEKGRRKVAPAPVGNDLFIPIPDWPSIITLEEHRRILDVIGGRSVGRPPAPRKLLTAIAQCGREGHRTLGGHTRSDGRPAAYRCTHAGCGLSIGQDALDAHVTERLLAYVTPAMWRRIRTGRRAVNPVDTVMLEAKLTELAEQWARDEITTPERDAARAVLLGRVADVEQRQADVELDLPDVADLHGAWEDLSTEAKRLVLSAFIDNVTVEPGAGGPDPDGVKFRARVDIRWR